MAADKHTGPLLRIVGSCEGCEHLHHRTKRGVPFEWTCGAWAEKSIDYSLAVAPAAPTWCPELPAARLALAREIVTEAERAEEQAREERIAKRSVFRLGEPR